MRVTTFGDDGATGARWVYTGRTVVLTDESAQSWAESVVSELKNSGATIIGSPTAGALSSTANFDIPGNLTLWLSVVMSRLPGGKSFQRSGLQPDIAVRPTIRDFQSGRDAVLERAVRFLQTGK